MTRARRVVRGLSALAGLVAVLVGVPYTLTALGQGRPGGVASWTAFTSGLSHQLTDSALLRAAGLLCWAVWALFVVAVATEIVRQLIALLGRTPAAGRGGAHFGIPGLQGWARTLVLTAALLLPQRAMAGATASPTVAAARPALVKVVVPGAPGRPSTAGGPRYVVQRYDSLWAIAERHLGRGTRWREIRDQSGRAVVDEAGRARTIHPGEVLFLPGPAHPAGAAHTAGPAHPAGAAHSAAPAHAARPAHPAAVPGPAAPAHPAGAAHTAAPAHPAAIPGPAGPVATNAAPVPAAPAPTSAAPGPTVVRSAGAARSPAAQPQAAPPAVPPPAGWAPPPSPQAPDGPPPTMVAIVANQEAANGTANIGAWVEGGLLGAAVLSIVRALRRRQAQHRPSGRRILLPGAAAASTELALRHDECPDRVALVERAVSALMIALRQTPTPLTVMGLVVDDDSVEILLDRPAVPPAPWTAAAEGFRWRILACGLPGPGSASRESAPLPALTPFGRVASGRADALVNLEAAGLVAVTGDRARVAGFLHGLATQLLGAPWAEAIDLILVGFPPGLTARDHVRAVGSASEVGAELRAAAEMMAATAAGQGCPDLFTGRLRQRAGDGWPPVVVLCAQQPSAAELELLAETARPGGGVVAVVANAGSLGRWDIAVDQEPCPINPLRLAVEPTVLDPATLADIAELLLVGEDMGGAGADDPPYDRIELSVERGVVAARRDRAVTARLADGPFPDVGNPSILVRVLGSVEVDGASEFKRAKSRELVVYLAMHPNGVGEAELDEALWGSRGGRVVLPSTRDSTVSVARTALGGPSRLLPAQGQGREKRYQVGPEVGSDWNQFCILHRYGRDRQSPTALRRALELVRGRPFEAVISGRTYGWIHTEGHGRHIEAEVADAADLAAGLFLESGDPIAARWAARRGLLAEPYTERLWVRLMEAADLLGESQEIERILDEMDVILELEGDFSSLHPNTLAVYDRLSRRHRLPATTT